MLSGVSLYPIIALFRFFLLAEQSGPLKNTFSDLHQPNDLLDSCITVGHRFPWYLREILSVTSC